MQSISSLNVDINIVRSIEASFTACNLDDLFEITLSNLLHVNHVCKGEIFLFNKQNSLVQVASAANVGPSGKKKQEIRVQSWIINSSVRHTSRRSKVPRVQSVYSIPLLESDTLLGFLSIQMDQITSMNDDLLDFILSGCNCPQK